MRLRNLNTQNILLLTLSSILVLATSFVPVVSEAKREEAEPILTVRYSYEKQTKDGQARYVLIPTPQKINAADYADPKNRYKALYMAMKNDKRSNYGETGFNMEGDVVLFFLDETKSRNFSFIMAEVIYTFTENGAKAVRFPKSKFDGKDYTRKDVSFPSYRLILPYWEGLPPNGLKSALLSLGDGSLLTAKALAERVVSNDKDLIEQLVDTLKKGELDAVKAIVETSKTSALNGIEPGFISLLASANSELRSLGITGLSGREGKDVFSALREVMDSDPSSEIKDQAALALSKSKDPNVAIAALFHNLRSKDVEIASKAALQLASGKSKEIDEQLLGAVKIAPPKVRKAAIDALVKRKVTGPLVSLLNGELALEAKIEIAQAIQSDKTARSEAYRFLVTQPNAEAASHAIKSLKGERLKGEVVDWFEKALRHPDAATRIITAETLKSAKGAEAIKVLEKADIDDKESGAAIHQTMREIYNGLSDKEILNDSARQSVISLKSAATGVLGQLYQRSSGQNKKRAFKAVGQLAQSGKAWVRAEAARSLGDIKGDEAKEALLKLKEDKDVKVKRSVARSAASFDEPTMRPVLLAYLKESDDQLIANSLLSLGGLQAIEALSDVFTDTYLDHKSVEVRRAAMSCVASLAEKLPMEKREGLPTRLNLRLSAESDSQTRRFAARALSFIPTEESRIALSTQLQDKDIALVKSLIDALVAHAVPPSIQLLEGAMDHRVEEVRAYAYQVAGNLTEEGLKAVAKALFERRSKMEDSPELKTVIQEALK